jgi:molecular chaperone GrpE
MAEQTRSVHGRPPSRGPARPSGHEEDREQHEAEREHDEADRRNEERIKALTEQVANLDDRWRRAAADLDNLRKRMGADVEHERALASTRAASALLPIIDNLDLALEHAEADPAALIQGILAVRDQAVAALRMLGYPRRDDLGTTFDPARHEAVGAQPDASVPPGTVVQVVRAGYGDGDRQLRPAAVVVATRPDSDAEWQ